MIFHDIQHHTTKLEREIDKKSPPYGGLQEFLLYLTVENPMRRHHIQYSTLFVTAHLMKENFLKKIHPHY